MSHHQAKASGSTVILNHSVKIHIISNNKLLQLLLFYTRIVHWWHFQGPVWFDAVVLRRCWSWCTWSDGTEHRNVWPFGGGRSFVRPVTETERIFQNVESH